MTIGEDNGDYAVEIWDDQDSPKRWRRVIISIEVIASDETKRAIISNQAQDVIQYTTFSLELAKSKLAEMKAEGWKCRIVDAHTGEKVQR